MNTTNPTSWAVERIEQEDFADVMDTLDGQYCLVDQANRTLAIGLTKQDAQLAAAAPKLLAALKGAIDAANHYSVCDMPQEIRFRCEGCQAANKAINVAELLAKEVA